MTALLGLNIPGDGSAPVDALVATGARLVRAVAYPDMDLRSYIAELAQRGIGTLLVLGQESIGGDPAGWAERTAGFYDGRYADTVYWQAGNEPDAGFDGSKSLDQRRDENPSSWVMDPPEFSLLLATVRASLTAGSYLICGGLASGRPDWLQAVDLSPVDAVAAHPYAKQPYSGDLLVMLGGYSAYSRPLWLTEYDSRTIEMSACLRDDARVYAALSFCYGCGVQEFNMLSNPAALADFVAAAGGQPAPAPSPNNGGGSGNMPRFQLGFKAAHDSAPDLVGDPLEDEYGPWQGASLQRTSTGLLFWGDYREAGSQLGFIDLRDGGRYRWDGNQLVRAG